MRKYLLNIALIFSLFISSSDIQAQFYNGYQMDFGKNRVQYDEFEWKYYRAEKFDTYFYVNGTTLAQFASQITEKKIKEFERFFEYQFEDRIIIQVYNSLADFKQSNLGYTTSSNENNIGGTTTIIKNRAFVYFEGDYRAFEEQITEVIAELMINQMLLGGSFTTQVANSTLMSMPQWYTKGLIRFMSEGWNENIDSEIRDAILSGKFEKFNRIEGEDAINAGYSIWNYIANRYGKNVIPNIIYLARISKSVESGFMFVLGTPFKLFTYDWLDYYNQQYLSDDEKRSIPSAETELHKTKAARDYQNIESSPDNKLFAYSTNEMGKYIVWLFDTETGKKKSIVRKEHRLMQITDYSYPILAWHPSGQSLSFITEEKGGFWLYFFELDSKELTKNEIFSFSKINDFSFSPDGKSFVFTAMKDGQVDVFTYNVLAHTHKAVTNDVCDEKDASYSNNRSSIVFASNRLSDSLNAVNTQHNYDIFVFQKGKEKLKRITNTPKVDEKQAIEITEQKYLFIDEKYGINNLSISLYDSSISFIDTSIHYKYFSKPYQLTNYKRNIKQFSYQQSDSKLTEIIHFQKKDRLFSGRFLLDEKTSINNIESTNWFKYKAKKQIKDSINAYLKDSVEQIEVLIEEPTDTNFINFEKYHFDITSLSETENNDSAKSVNRPKGKQRFKPIYYFTSFYNNQVVTQIDFGFLNQSYQAYTGSAVYYNPGFNVFLKMGVADMFDDYRFTVGTRLSANLNSAEYLFSLENLKKRLDKQYIFHRQALEETDGVYYRKTYSHQFMYILKWPFNQVSSIRGTAKYRNDNAVYKSVDVPSLAEEDDNKNWAGLKLEYIFDNSIPLGLNLYRGWRNKVFAEAYKQIDGEHPDLYVLGFDLRHYFKIHRSMILASRFAGSSSFGENKLMYYLGSTDNWMNFSKKTPTFDESVKRNQNVNWAFQSLATNMRGFPQNVRNGNTFFVLNNEIRLPFVRYFFNTPITSPFLYNLQFLGFFDVGTAWTGASPNSSENLYNQNDIIQGEVKITIDNQRSPFVYGYGGGVRTKLLGYFIRADLAWGIDGDVALPSIFYLSLSLDF